MSCHGKRIIDMSAYAKSIRKNTIFKITILFSLGIHLVIFIKMTGLYQSHSPSYIELTLERIFKPSSRSIPRPLKQFKPMQSTDINELTVKERKIPSLKVKFDNLELNSFIAEQIFVPMAEDRNEIPEGIISDPARRVVDESLSDFTTSKDYYGMIRMKIEQYKQYPQSAKMRHQQGRVTVSFIIDQQGRLSELRIVNGSRFKVLDRAALEAVRASAPFSKPPVALFKKPLQLELTILFELT